MRRALETAFSCLVLCSCKPSGGETRDQPATTSASMTMETPAAVRVSLPPGRTPIPSLAEYAAAREVTVKGSSALHCETKMIREWLRVACRDKNDTGGTPTTLKILRGGRGESITYAAAGVTTLITPVLEGTDFEAVFSWTDKSHPLVIQWPQRAPKPVIVGSFQGAASPLDGTAPSAILCSCHKRLMHVDDCAEAPMAQPDCERTYSDDCARLLSCARGEPVSPPQCPPGKRNAGVTGWCATICGPGKPPCPSGTRCEGEPSDPPVCM